MVYKYEKIFSEVLDKINLSDEELKEIDSIVNNFLLKIKKRIKKLKLDVEPFVGGSYAKKTLVKKKNYDVDIFLRFNKKYDEKDYTKLTKKILRFVFGISKVHGSREYFRLNLKKGLSIEIVPVLKVNKPTNSKNITDLSYSHVKYINKKLKNEKLRDEIKLMKTFCKANKVYGAESYISGFSGYAIELLIYKYGSFIKTLKKLSKIEDKKLIIDLENFYKGKDVLREINSSKLSSPIILIDPTFKERNVLAALSYETFEKFKIAAKKFLKTPSKEFFEEKEFNSFEARKKAEEKSHGFLEYKIKTKKQRGDVAGTKLLKFHRHLIYEFQKYFEVIEQDFTYSGKKEGFGYLVLKKKEFIYFNGPKEEDKKNLEKFKAEHEDFYIENGRLMAKERIQTTPKEFLKNWLKKNKRKVKEMYITKVVVY